MTCSIPRRILSVSSAGLCVLLLGGGRGAQAQQRSDAAVVGQLAGLLAAADARRFDAAVLRDALAHADPGVRRQAALAAGRIGDPAAIDLLVPLLRDTTPAVQQAAAFALGLLRDPRAITPLLQVAREEAAGPAARAEAVTALAKIGGDAAPAVAEILAMGSPAGAASPSVAAALLESWRLGARAPVVQLLAYVDHADAATRWRALYSLGRLRAPRGASRLVAALRDRDPAVRAIAARGVTRALLDSARVDPRGAVDGLRPLLADRDPHVRINALRSLASFRDSTLARYVAPLVGDRHPGVAVQAETTLGVLGGAAARETLRSRLTSGVFAQRRQAAIALAQADSGAGLAAAAALAADPDWRWRRVAAEAFDAARAGDRLEALLDDPDGRVVTRALEGLQRHAPAADPALRARARGFLAHEDAAVRSVAADLLGRHPSVDDVDPLIAAYHRAERDVFNDARLSAVTALGAVAAVSPEGRERVAVRFVTVVPPPDDYLVRRRAADTIPGAREAWGPAHPITTGRSIADYRDVARRWLAPALAGAPNPRVTLETDRGALEIELLPSEAPLTVAAFLELVERRFFDGTRWHRVVPNFVVQDGDPRGDGWGGPGFALRDEVNPVRYETGSVGMALSGPDTGGSQYFITHSRQPHLDGVYTIFGRVVGGGAVVEEIGQGDRIRSVHR